jgi:hypothetical protein
MRPLSAGHILMDRLCQTVGMRFAQFQQKSQPLHERETLWLNPPDERENLILYVLAIRMESCPGVIQAWPKCSNAVVLESSKSRYGSQNLCRDRAFKLNILYHIIHGHREQRTSTAYMISCFFCSRSLFCTIKFKFRWLTTQEYRGTQ